MLRTFAVWRIRIVTGAGPQSNVTTPPRATAATTAAEVQLAGVPVPHLRRVGHARAHRSQCEKGRESPWPYEGHAGDPTTPSAWKPTDGGMEDDGIEPTTSALQRRRSPS